MELKQIKFFIPVKSKTTVVCNLPEGFLDYLKATGHMDSTMDNRGDSYIASDIITVDENGKQYVSASNQMKEGYVFTKEELQILLTDMFERGERSCLDKDEFINSLFA